MLGINLSKGVCLESALSTCTFVFGELIMRLLKVLGFIFYCCIALVFIINLAPRNLLLAATIFFPLCSWIVVVLHELSHWICFRAMGFRVKELKISLLLIRFDNGICKITLMSSGMFRGFCAVEKIVQKPKTRLIIPLLSGGISGLLTSIVSISVLTLNIIPEKWNSFFISLFCVSLYSFYTTLLNPKSADGKLIREIIKEEIVR